MESIEIFLQIFAGLGLFFVGINVLSYQMKQLSGPYARKIITSLATNDFKATLGGLISGFITSSGKAVTFSLVGLSVSGLLNVRKSLPIIIGGSLGSAFIVLWASLDFKLIVFIILGIAGIFYQFGNMKDAKTRMISGIFLGLGLLFYGLYLIKLGAAPIKEYLWFEELIVSTKDYWLLALIIGAIAALVSQSGSSITIIAIPLVNVGLLDMDQAIMLVFGTNVGSGVGTAVLALGLSGTSRQLVMFHAFFKAIGVLVMVPLLYLETHMGVPSIKFTVSALTDSLGMQIALIYLLYEILTGIALWRFMNLITIALSLYSPPSSEDALSKLKYINDADIQDTSGAPVLLLKEQARILEHLPRYLCSICDKVTVDKNENYEILYSAHKKIGDEIGFYLSRLIASRQRKEQIDILLDISRLQELTNAICEDLYAFVKVVEKYESENIPHSFIEHLTERLLLALNTAHKGMDAGSVSDARKIELMTQDGGDLVRQLKEEYIAEYTELGHDAKSLLLDIIFYYDRAIWLLNRQGKTLIHLRE